MNLKLAGKSALVLGSSRGIGFAAARMLAREGARVILNGRSEGALLYAKKRILKDLPKAEVSLLVCDLTDSDQISELAKRLASDEIGCDILINNTGGPSVQPLSLTSTFAWKAAANQLMFPVFEITQAALVPMVARGWGRIITIVSSGVQQPIPDLGISNTLRSGIVAWSKTLATEVASAGVTCNCVIPGRIKTERLLEVDSIRAHREGTDLAEVERRSCESIPVGRYGDPDEMASAICFLAAEGSSYITGSTLRVDGGLIKAP